MPLENAIGANLAGANTCTIGVSSRLKIAITRIINNVGAYYHRPTVTVTSAITAIAIIRIVTISITVRCVLRHMCVIVLSVGRRGRGRRTENVQCPIDTHLSQFIADAVLVVAVEGDNIADSRRCAELVTMRLSGIDRL